jgi:hypothetical protein
MLPIVGGACATVNYVYAPFASNVVYSARKEEKKKEKSRTKRSGPINCSSGAPKQNADASFSCQFYLHTHACGFIHNLQLFIRISGSYSRAIIQDFAAETRYGFKVLYRVLNRHVSPVSDVIIVGRGEVLETSRITAF